MTSAGPVYIPHLRRWVTWEYDTTDWPFVPLRDDGETEEERALRMHSLDQVYRYGQHWLEVPEPNAESEDEQAVYEEYEEAAYTNYMRDMAMLGHWDLLRQKGGRPNALRKTIVFRRDEFRENDVLAHVMHRAGLFESVGEARRNGWNRPIACDLHKVGRNSHSSRVLVINGEPPPRLRTTVEVEARFEGGNHVFRIQEEPEDDPVGDWACWCRRWTGESFEGYWLYFEKCRRSDALAQTQSEIVYAVRAEPSVLGKDVKIETIMPQIKRLDVRRYDALALQVEQSRACIDGRPVRKFLGLGIAHV